MEEKVKEEKEERVSKTNTFYFVTFLFSGLDAADQQPPPPHTHTPLPSSLDMSVLARLPSSVESPLLHSVSVEGGSYLTFFFFFQSQRGQSDSPQPGF